MIKTQTIVVVTVDGAQHRYWCIVPHGMSNEQAFETQELHGPFTTDAEVHEDERRTLLGPQGKVIEAGMWDPAWDKPQ